MKHKYNLLIFFIMLILVIQPVNTTVYAAEDTKAAVTSSIHEINDKLFDQISHIVSIIKNIQLSSKATTQTYQSGFTYGPVPQELQSYMYGNSYKSDCTLSWSELNYITVKYYDFNNSIQTGEIVCNKAIAKDLVEIFYELYLNQYQLEHVQLVDHYQADDELSMEDNNTSCFNYRTVPGKTTMSKHSLGLAIDMNPFYNPYVTKNQDGTTSITPFGSEAYADRASDNPHKITTDDLCYKLFIAHGFTWGGSWKSSKDYQHFQKNI